MTAADLKWPFHPITDTQRDGSRYLVWVPGKGASRGHWIFARWFTDGRALGEMTETRRRLTISHGGYWSAHFGGGKPLKRAPTFYMSELPDLEAK